jgi:hypothetical protein
MPKIQAFSRPCSRHFVAFYGNNDNPAPALVQKTCFSGAFLCAGSLLAFFSRLASVVFCDLGADQAEAPLRLKSQRLRARGLGARF